MCSSSCPHEGKGKVEVFQLQFMKAHERCGCIFTATALERGRFASPMLGLFYSRESPQYSFYRRLSGPQDQSGYEEVKKTLHPSDTRDRTRVVQPIAKRLAAWATWPTPSGSQDDIPLPYTLQYININSLHTFKYPSAKCNMILSRGFVVKSKGWSRERDGQVIGPYALSIFQGLLLWCYNRYSIRICKKKKQVNKTWQVVKHFANNRISGCHLVSKQ